MFHKNERPVEAQKIMPLSKLSLAENGVFITENMMAGLAPDKKKNGIFEKTLRVAISVVCVNFLLAVVLAFGKYYGIVSAGQIQFVANTFIAITAICFVSLTIVISWEMYLTFKNSGANRNSMIDAHILKEEKLLAHIKSSEFSRNELNAYCDRISLCVKQLKERSTIVVIFSALYVALHGLSEATGIDLAGHLGISVLVAAGMGALVLRVQAEKYERLQHVLQRAVAASPLDALRTRSASRRREVLSRK